MSFHYSPKIVTDGLVLALDSHNPKSYPGTGTTWYDLSGNNNHGTLYNFTGPGASTTSGYNTTTKHMMFDRHVSSSDGAANNYVGIPNSASLDGVLCENGMTIAMWLRMDSYTCTAFTKWNASWELYYCSNLVFRTQGTGGSDGNSGVSYSANYQNFHSIIATHDGFTRKFYINGVEVYSAANTISGQNTTNPIGIGAYHGGNYAFFGAIPYYSLYNRPLSQKEVTQTHNTLKGRFGL